MQQVSRKFEEECDDHGSVLANSIAPLGDEVLAAYLLWPEIHRRFRRRWRA
jgi:hypothetical protein